MKSSLVDPFYRAFGRRVRDARDPLMSQDLLAQALGLGRTSVTNIEAGRQHVSLATAAAIARLLDVSLDALSGQEFLPRAGSGAVRTGEDQ